MNKRGNIIDVIAFMIVCFIIGTLLFGILGLFIMGHIGASSGEHTGYVSSVEHNTNVIWPADLVYFKTSPQSTQEDVYCVNDINVKDQLAEASEQGKKITIHYANPFFTWKWICNGGQSVIYKISWRVN